MSEEPEVYRIPDKDADEPMTPLKVRSAQYAYFGLRDRPDPALRMLYELCQVPDCPKMADRTLTLQPVQLKTIEVEVVLCDDHANGFYPPPGTDFA